MSSDTNINSAGSRRAEAGVAVIEKRMATVAAAVRRKGKRATSLHILPCLLYPVSYVQAAASDVSACFFLQPQKVFMSQLAQDGEGREREWEGREGGGAGVKFDNASPAR